MPDLMQDRNINQPRDFTAPATERPRVREEETSAEVVGGGSLAEGLCGIAAVVLAIIGLSGALPFDLGGVTAIVVGAGLLLEGAAIGTRFSRLLDETAGQRFSLSELGGGMTAEFLAGAAGIVLGILALIGIHGGTLLAVSAIVFGAALLLGAGASATLNGFVVEHHYRDREMVRRAASGLVSAATGAQVLIGLGAVILGIIALTTVYTLTLSLVAFLIVGAALAICGMALGTRMLRMVSR